jgi:hypothetical protein
MDRGLFNGPAILLYAQNSVDFAPFDARTGAGGRWERVAGLSHRRTPMSTRAPVSLVELAAAAPLDPIEAVTIVREVVQRVIEHELPGVPSAHVIRLSPSGGVVIIEGPIAAHGSAVRRAAQLLEALLPPFDARVRVPGALRLLVARALGTLDLPPYPSLESFAEALSRFAAIDPGECLRQVVASRPEQPHTVIADEVAATHEATITVSDIRRARRTTGVSLSDISRRCQVPMQLLRELEWGYLANWPASQMGRRLLTSYARAAGLDEELVIRTVWPLLAEWVQARGALATEEPAPLTVVDVPVEPARRSTSTSLARIEPVLARRWDARRIVAMLTIPALLAIGAAPALWQQHSAARREAQSQTTAPAARVVPPPMMKPEGQPAASQTDVMLAVPAPTRQPVPTSGSTVRQASYRAPQQVVTKNKRAAAAKSAKGPQVRRSVSRSKGPRKWGVWVLNKVGVRIVSTEQHPNNP